MSFEIKCDRCKKELKELGALAFSPPEEGQCYKFHLCVSCWKKILEVLNAPDDEYTELGAEQWDPVAVYSDEYPNSYLAIDCNTKLVVCCAQNKTDFIQLMGTLPANIDLLLCNTFDHVG